MTEYFLVINSGSWSTPFEASDLEPNIPLTPCQREIKLSSQNIVLSLSQAERHIRKHSLCGVL